MNNEVLVMDSNGVQTPKQATEGSAGYDLRSNEQGSVILRSKQRLLVHTGINIKMPKGMVAMVCPRSGLALKYGISVANAPGVIDSDYIDEIGVILVNHGDSDFTITHGDRIAQLLFLNFVQPEFKQVDRLETTTRSGGFGSTGINNLNGSFS